MAAPLVQGRLVWVTVPDPQGRNPKRRPAVVLTATADIAPDGELTVAAVTTRTGVAPADAVVPLPWHRDGHPRTRLRQPCEVVCNWVLTVPMAAVEGTAGLVPGDRLAQVLARVAALRPPETPPDSA